MLLYEYHCSLPTWNSSFSPFQCTNASHSTYAWKKGKYRKTEWNREKKNYMHKTSCYQLMNLIPNGKSKSYRLSITNTWQMNTKEMVLPLIYDQSTLVLCDDCDFVVVVFCFFFYFQYNCVSELGDFFLYCVSCFLLELQLTIPNELKMRTCHYLAIFQTTHELYD